MNLLLNLYTEHQILEHVLSTFQIFLSGLICSYILSLILIVLGLRWSNVRKLIYFMVGLLQPIPRIVLFPLLLILMGINDIARTSLVLVGLLFSNYLILDSQFNHLKWNPLKKILKVYKVQRLKILYYYYLRGALPALGSSYKNSVGYGLTLAIVAESSFSNKGLGFLIWKFWERYDMPELYLTIGLVSVLALLLNLIPRGIKWMMVRSI